MMDIKLFMGSITSVLKSKGVVEGGTGAIAKEIEKAKTINSDIQPDEDIKADV